MDPILVDVTHRMNAHGLDIASFDEGYLLRSIEKRISSCNLRSIAEYPDFLAGDPQEVRILFNSLQNSFSEFFRDSLTFAGLEYIILPELIMQKRNRSQSEIRIWSAGCAAGQEAYSVAILLYELLSGNGRDLCCHIIATDNNPDGLEAGRQGFFPESALRQVSMDRLSKYFTRQKNGSYQVISPIRERVDFSRYDLLDENTSGPPAGIFGDFDLVLCSNLLIYYAPQPRRTIINRLRHSLAENGYLVTGVAEKDMLSDVHDLRRQSFSSSIFKRHRH